MEKDSKKEPKRDPSVSRLEGRGIVLIFLAMMIGYMVFYSQLSGSGLGMVKMIPYTEFKTLLADDQIESCSVGEQDIRGLVKSGDEEYQFRSVRIDDPDLLAALEAAGVEANGVKSSPFGFFMLMLMLPLLLILLMGVLGARKMGQAAGGMFSVGKSKAQLVLPEDSEVTFDDVAGCDEAKEELQEVVQFLEDPKRFFRMGAKIPRGVLLVGPPGTGKTLMARAVAGEAGTPFYSLSGSDFVEMFVGVGAARVRDLFQTARKNSPCIIFIDELDAIGRTRGVHLVGGNDEREQTLNQLLVEMDGFDTDAGVIVLSATNRPDVLDRALLRPGRFDRQVTVDVPDAKGREAILKIHAKGKPLYDDVDLKALARSTPGLSGADLANLLNEAALLAVRRDGKAIRQADLEEAMEKVIAGPQRKSRLLSPRERKRVAFHEVGHALVAAYSEGAEQVRKISIIPRGNAALGYTLQWPEEEHFLQTRDELIARIRCLLGGRASEEFVFGEVTTGASNDLERATQMARHMIGSYGMSDQIGLATVAVREEYLRPGEEGTRFDCSEATARKIDEEVKSILDTAYSEATGILQDHGDELNEIAELVMKEESLSGERFYKMISAEPGPNNIKKDHVRLANKT